MENECCHKLWLFLQNNDCLKVTITCNTDLKNFKFLKILKFEDFQAPIIYSPGSSLKHSLFAILFGLALHHTQGMYVPEFFKIICIDREFS